jgi:molybdopterin synthase catalytic subunit
MKIVETKISPTPCVSIQTADFDVGAEISALRAADTRIGAVTTFIGTVRDQHHAYQSAHRSAEVSSMEIEHYPGMTERAIETMINAALQRFDVCSARIIHRVGLLQLQDNIVMVAVAASHRGPAFSACEFLMDYLKTQAPFWKKETTPQGSHWVDARSSDDAALARWNTAPTAATNSSPEKIKP